MSQESTPVGPDAKPSYAVIIPTLTSHIQQALDCASEHLYQIKRCDSRGAVIIALNGPTDDDAWYKTLNLVRPLGIHCIVMGCTGSNNPYKARNSALTRAFLYGAKFCALTDSDCTPARDYHKVLLEQGATGFDMLAGKITTTIPSINSPHFNALRAVAFECYDGYTPFDSPVGANMVISRSTWEALGPMRDTKRCGGDQEYGTRAKANSLTPRPCRALHVRKCITGFTFQGVLTKQIQRGAEVDDGNTPPLRTSKRALALLLRRMANCLEQLPEDLEEGHAEYKDLIDDLFGAQYLFGVLSKTFDKVTTPCDA